VNTGTRSNRSRPPTPERWHEVVRNNLNSVSAKLCREFAGVLIHEGKMDALKETLARLISQHTASSELLLWLAKDRSDAFADILGPEVFRAMLTAMERDQFNEKRSKPPARFHPRRPGIAGGVDRLSRPRSHQGVDPRTATFAQFRRHGQTLAAGAHRQELSGGSVPDFRRISPNRRVIWSSSWESLERRKDEYHELGHKKIPANSHEIAIAPELRRPAREHEYKAGQGNAETLRPAVGVGNAIGARARTDFANARTDVVSIGTRVNVTDLQTNNAEHFTGFWARGNSDPDGGTIS